MRNQIPFGKPLSQFVPSLLTILLDYGKLDDGRHALEAILESAGELVGKEKRERCTTLIQQLQACNFGDDDRSFEESEDLSEETSKLHSRHTSKGKAKKPRIIPAVSLLVGIAAIAVGGIWWYINFFQKPLILDVEMFPEVTTLSAGADPVLLIANTRGRNIRDLTFSWDLAGIGEVKSKPNKPNIATYLPPTTPETGHAVVVLELRGNKEKILNTKVIEFVIKLDQVTMTPSPIPTSTPTLQNEE